MRQLWRRLLFLHWEVPVTAMREVVPRSMELDLFEGRAFVGVLPFVIHGARPTLVPRRAGLDFLETNVRTYVVVDGEPGIFFFSLEAASYVAVAGARAGFGLPYFPASMSIRGDERTAVTYESRRLVGGARHRVRYRVGGALGRAEPGTVDHFLIERYVLFVERFGRVMRDQVHHAPYPLQRAEVLEVHDELVAAAGLPKVQGSPAYVHYASGVDVEIFRPHLVHAA